MSTDPLGRWLTRRQALKHAGTGFGYLALAGLLGRDAGALAAAGGSPSREHPLAPKAAALPGQGQADHLPVHERGHLPDGHLGLQAAAPEGRRQGRAGRRGPDRLEVQVPPARPDRHVGLRAVPAHGQARRHALLPPRPAHRHAGPPRGRDPAPHRHGDRVADPAVAGRVAPLRAGDREPGPPRLRDHQPAAQLRRGGQLRQRVPPGPFPGDQDQRQRLHAEPRRPRRPGRSSASRST